MEGLGIHPIAEIFPRMSGDEFFALKADIKERGLLEPIWIYEGKVLDGRHRYNACQEVGVERRFREYEGSDPVGFVISLNLKRRHLNESQRAVVASRLANLDHGGNRKKQDANLHLDHGESDRYCYSCSYSGYDKGDVCTLHHHELSFDSFACLEYVRSLDFDDDEDEESVAPITRQQAADMLQVSQRSVATAAKVDREAPVEVVDAVLVGAMSLNLAAQVSALPEEELAIVAATPVDQIKAIAREAVHNHRAQGTGENEWYTPTEYIEAAREMMGGIDVDPASSSIAQETVKAESFFTIDDDGLKQPWRGKVWLNPPYAQPAIHDFMAKTVGEWTSGNMEEGIALTHNYTDTRWFHLAAQAASAICFTRGRIGFLSPDGKKAAPTQGQAFFYFGTRREDFADAFCKFGFVMVKP